MLASKCLQDCIKKRAGNNTESIFIIIIISTK